MRQPPAIVISRTWTQICTPGSSREGRNRRHYAPIVTARPTGTRIARIVLARQEDPARPPARGKRRQPRDARGQPIPAPSSMREAHARSANGASTGKESMTWCHHADLVVRVACFPSSPSPVVVLSVTRFPYALQVMLLLVHFRYIATAGIIISSQAV